MYLSISLSLFLSLPKFQSFFPIRPYHTLLPLLWISHSISLFLPSSLGLTRLVKSKSWMFMSSAPTARCRTSNFLKPARVVSLFNCPPTLSSSTVAMVSLKHVCIHTHTHTDTVQTPTKKIFHLINTAELRVFICWWGMWELALTFVPFPVVYEKVRSLVKPVCQCSLSKLTI